MVEDEEYAEMIIAHEDTQERQKPRRFMNEWSVEVELLTQLVDRVGELIAVSVVAAGAKKPPKVPSLPRPMTAIERVRNRRRQHQHQSLVARVLPNKDGGDA